MAKIYQNVRNLVPGRSVFNLSYCKKFDCDMGQLIPVMCDEVVPGDIFKIGNQAVVRMQPLVAPILHQIDMYVYYFFIPNRLLWNSDTREELEEEGDWEEFITGGTDGNNADTLPTWNPVNNGQYSLWDYLGFPIDKDPDGCYPLDFPRRAYNLVWNEYFRDENLQVEAALDNEEILLRNWSKDYFTSALLTQQKGTAPSLPLSGTGYVHGIGKANVNFPDGPFSPLESDGSQPSYTGATKIDSGAANNTFYVEKHTVGATDVPNIRVDFADAATFDVADLRLAFQVQKFMERNQRAGNRYTEFLRGHFGISPRDERLQRPEYIGGSKAPVIVSEVLQTSSTDVVTPQGNMAGHGISVSDSFCGSYRATEFGLILGLMSIMPKAVYQDGINRQWLRETRYDFMFPEFVNLSEQAIINGEIFITDADDTTNKTIFGYQGRYDEMRTKSNMICGGMRDTFDYWHLSRQFANVPTLNSDFIECDPRKDCFAAPAEPAFFVDFANIIKAVRPLPFIAEPGLLDHN